MGFGVLLNVLNHFSNVGFGKAQTMFFQVLLLIILNPYQGKITCMSDLFTSNSSKCHLVKLLFDVLKVP